MGKNDDQKGLYEETVSACTKATNRDPNDAISWLLKAFALFELARYEESVDAWNGAIEINPEDANLWHYKGLALFRLERYEEALDVYNRAMEIDPKDAVLWRNKGLALLRLERYEEALDVYNRAIEIDPKNADAWHSKGLALCKLERYQEGVAAYDKGIEMNPKHADAWHDRGIGLGRLERYEEALDAFNRALKVNPEHPTAWYNKGLALYRLDRYEEALDAYNRMIEIDPETAGAWNAKGLAFERLKRYEEALDAYNRVIEIDPEDALAWHNKGFSLRKLERYEEAVDAYSRAIEIDPGDADTWHGRGLALGHLERYEEAVDDYNTAIKVNPKDVLAWYRKGCALEHLDRYEDAIRCYRKTIELDPHNENAKAALASLEQGRQKKGQAKVFEAAGAHEADEESEGALISLEHTQRGKEQAEIAPHRVRPSVFSSSFPGELNQYYSDVSFIGSGGFARVFRAKRRTDGTEVAVKIPLFGDPKTGKSFIREITSWQVLEHRNIVKLYDFNVLPLPYLEMELCDGSLEDLPKPVGVEEATRLVFDIANGLSHAHAKHIIHRDLKPGNILTRTGIPKISDWGLSKTIAMGRSSGTPSFSPMYAAPEQLSPDRFGKPDYRTDIYQLGAIFYELVTGELPHKGDSITEIMAQILMGQPEFPSQLDLEKKGIKHIIIRCLEKKMSQRYQSVDQLQRELAEYLKVEYEESLGRSHGDMRRSGHYCAELCLVHLQVGNTSEALKYALDLTNYASGQAKVLLTPLIGELEFRRKEEQAVPEDLIERAGVVLHQVKMGW
ncbi:MAG: tetratricopeptide repeat protein [Dehalococcoidia bacterium]